MSKELFIKDGNNYLQWKYKAEDLVSAGERLYCLHDFTIPIMLMAMGIECYIKGIISKTTKLIDSNGKFNSTINSNHQLDKLLSQSGIKYENKHLLEKLSDAINNWGRYPIPRKHTNHRKKRFPGQMGGINPITWWSESDYDDLKVLINMLKGKIDS